jgi:glycosyltransferase involved in cell wall biosynthesis
MVNQLTALLADRVKDKAKKLDASGIKPGFADILGKIELPLHLRTLFGQEPASSRPKDQSGVDLGKVSDGLPFPALAAVALGGSAFAASKVLYGKRPFLDGFARRLGRYEHPKRALWLTDTLEDKNGVSHVLQAMLGEARRRDLPVDFLACATGKAGGLRSGPHLALMPAVSEFTLPFYPDQAIRLPGLMDLQKLFLEGGYDRIICSTEAPMGLLALYLKHAFNVPAYFYAHSDWLDFARRVLRYDKRKIDRLRRFLRAFYRRFDGVFLLNAEQRDAFASPAMGLAPDRLFLTAHWADARFHPRAADKSRIFPGPGPVLLYAGRLSEEKGVLDLPGIFRKVKERIPEARLAIAGTGPCLDRLQAAAPDAIFLGWIGPDRLAQAYSAADLLLLPSWFDTFSCSLLEALGCGLPALAFDTKGPRDILAGESGGLLAESPAQMADLAARLLEDPGRLRAFKARALERAAAYRPVPILDGMMRDLGLAEAVDGIPAAPDRVREPAQADAAPGPEPALLGELLALMET